jgi:hypothetical protein
MLRKARHDFKANVFYQIPTRRRLAEILRCSVKTLEALETRDQKYRRLWKHKEDDTLPWEKVEPPADQIHLYRPIDIPAADLKKLQGRVATLLSAIDPPKFLFSPVRGVSYVHNAAVHRGAKCFWMLDIEKYFPSCREARVAWFFRRRMRCSPDVTAILVQLTTHEGSLPQGAPSSPILSYFSNLGMWDEIAAAVEEFGCTFSVYADDITISGLVVPGALIWKIKQIIFKHGLTLNGGKEHSLVSCPADITGVIVDGDRLKWPHRQRRRLIELEKQRKHTKAPEHRRKLENQIAGRLAQQKQVELHVERQAAINLYVTVPLSLSQPVAIGETGMPFDI